MRARGIRPMPRYPTTATTPCSQAGSRPPSAFTAASPSPPQTSSTPAEQTAKILRLRATRRVSGTTTDSRSSSATIARSTIAGTAASSAVGAGFSGAPPSTQMSVVAEAATRADSASAAPMPPTSAVIRRTIRAAANSPTQAASTSRPSEQVAASRDGTRSTSRASTCTAAHTTASSDSRRPNGAPALLAPHQDHPARAAVAVRARSRTTERG